MKSPLIIVDMIKHVVKKRIKNKEFRLNSNDLNGVQNSSTVNKEILVLTAADTLII